MLDNSCSPCSFCRGCGAGGIERHAVLTKQWGEPQIPGGSHTPTVWAALLCPRTAAQAERKESMGKSLSWGRSCQTRAAQRWPREQGMLPRTPPEQGDRCTSQEGLGGAACSIPSQQHWEAREGQASGESNHMSPPPTPNPGPWGQ